MNKHILALAATLLSVLQLSAGNSVKVTSPDRKIAMTFCTEKGQLQYRLEFRNKEIITKSSCGLQTEKGFVGSDVRLGKAVYRKGCEEYDLVVGKKSHVSSPWCEALVPLTDGGGNGLSLSLQIRVFDDAAAYRLIFKSNNAADGTIRIANERMDLNPVGNPTATTMFFDSFINTHEAPYVRKHIDNLNEDRLMDLPVHFEFPDGTNLAFTEADVRNYAGMYLVRKDGRLTSRLSPRLDDPRYSVILDKEGKTPWRVFMVADRPGTLMESTVLTSLCEPCRIEDCSWIKPGKTTFPWWNDTQLPDTTFQAGNNFLTNKYYIDFAADNGLEYHSVYGYADMPWYYDDGPGFGIAGPGADLTRPDPRLDFEAVCRYARSRGVDIHVWLNWAALYKDIDRVFDKFNEWGVKGMMVDFMDRDDQEMIEIQETILRKAAEHQLFIQFHGASKPSGLSRTWPNEFTREGTLNYEVYKWDKARQMGADHDINIPFTRGLAGPADFHLGGFRSVAAKDFKVKYSAPLVTSTRCHMLAMYVVLESYLNMVCDYPDAYRGQPGFSFIEDVPTTWDETRVLSAEASKYIVTARRKGTDWYVGGITDSGKREFHVDFGFLGEGNYRAELYMDADDTDEYPDHLIHGTRILDSDSEMTIKAGASGGFVMKLCPCDCGIAREGMTPPDTTAGLWIRPNGASDSRPKWGFADGIQVGIAPTGGPRGLLRIYTPYLGQPDDYVMNFIAVEPIPHNGKDIRGLSELEKSQIDGRQGKIFWSSDDDILDDADKAVPARGVISTVDGEQQLTVYIFTEKFLNGTEPYLRLKFQESRPYEFEISTFTRENGNPEPDYCIVTATMGNKARLRNLYLKDGTLHSGSIWPNYRLDGFAEHYHIPAERMISGSDGAVWFIAAPDEEDPASTPLAKGTSPGWKYYGATATQYWKKPLPESRTEGLVNGRFAYWASRAPIPGGIAYENFEIKSPFRQGDTFIFGISPLSPERFIESIR